MARSVHVALLSYKAEPCLQVMEFLQKEMMEMAQLPDTTVAYTSLSGDSMLPHARNVLVANFVARNGTDLIFMDDDNYPDPGGLRRLISHDVDVVGLPCRAKEDECKWPVRWLTDRPVEQSANGLIEVESTGTGIIRFSRKCIDRMILAQQDRWYHDKTADGGKAWPLFEYQVKNNLWHGEDVTFCLRWRELGGKVFIDPAVNTHHVGKKGYSGAPGPWLAAMPKTLSITGDPVVVENRLAGL